jgi:PleD family two-component response regulator
MGTSAIIIAEKADQRREIAQSISPLEFFDQLHFCGSLQELRLFLSQVQPQIIFCETGSVDNEDLRITATLTSLAKKHHCQIAFFSSSEPGELLQLGILPPGSHCLSYQMDKAELKNILQPLLSRHASSTPRGERRPLKQMPLSHSSGIYSRFSFNNFLLQERSRSTLTGRPFSLLLIGPQSVEKLQNPTHDWDPLLPTLAMRIKTLIRNSDLLCHFEAQRLALLLPETATINAQKVVSRIRDNLSDLNNKAAFNLQVSLSAPTIDNHAQHQIHGNEPLETVSSRP